MVTGFFFRSAVSCAALWNLKMKIVPQQPKQDKLVIFYDNGNRIKAVIK